MPAMPDADADPDDGGVSPAIIGGAVAVAVVGLLLLLVFCRARSRDESLPAFGDRVRVGERTGIVCEGPDEDGIYRIAYDDDGTISDYLDATEIQKSGEERRASDLRRASQLIKKLPSLAPQRLKTQAELEMTLCSHAGPRGSFSARNIAKTIAGDTDFETRPADPVMPPHWGASVPPRASLDSTVSSDETAGVAKEAEWTPDDVFRDRGLLERAAAAAANPAPSSLAGSTKEKRSLHVKFRLNKLTSMCQWDAIDFDALDLESGDGTT